MPTAVAGEGFLANALPEWGLVKLLRALESRSVNGTLTLKLEAGTVHLSLEGGKVQAVVTQIRALSTAAFFRSRGLSSPSQRSLLQRVLKKTLPLDEARRLQTEHTRHVLLAILPLPVLDWRVGTLAMDISIRGKPIALTNDLVFKAIGRYGDVESLRKSLATAMRGGAYAAVEGTEPLLSETDLQYGETAVVRLLRAGRSVGESILTYEPDVRALFALRLLGGVALRKVQAPPARATAQADQDREKPRAPAVEAPPEPKSRRNDAKAGAPDAAEEPVLPKQSSSEALRELRETVELFNTANLYEILGVSLDAGISEIETAYLKAMRRFARVRYDVENEPDLGRYLDTIHDRLDKARATLTERDPRTEYNRSIRISTASLDWQLAVTFEALAAYRRGRKSIEHQDLATALDEFEAAYRLDPREPEYAAAIATTLLAGKPSDDAVSRARILVDSALEANPDLVSALLARAQLFRRDGLNDDAMDCVRRALRLDPNNAEARNLKNIVGAAKGRRQTFRKEQSGLIKRILRFLRQKSQ